MTEMLPKSELVPQSSRHVFVSYSHKDAAELAEKIDDNLQLNGFKTWRDVHAENIVPGVPFGDTLRNAIDGAFAVVAIISLSCLNDSAVRWWLKCEWYYAISKGISIIPVLKEDVADDQVPFEFCAVQHFSASSGIDDLCDRLSVALEFVKSQHSLQRNIGVDV